MCSTCLASEHTCGTGRQCNHQAVLSQPVAFKPPVVVNVVFIIQSVVSTTHSQSSSTNLLISNLLLEKRYNEGLSTVVLSVVPIKFETDLGF